MISGFSIKILRVMLLGVVMLLVIVDLNTPAHAGDFKSSLANPAKSVDTNQSGMIEKANTDQRFVELDTNKDGKISLKEAVKDQNLIGVFDTTDTNHDGMITADEYAYYTQHMSAVRAN